MAELGNEVAADVVEIIPEEEVRVCLFKMGEEYYAVPVAIVMEIMLVQKIFPVPSAPSHVLGIINLRGNIVPIVDIRPALSLPQQTVPNHIAIIKHGPITLGIVIDGVSDVISIPESSIMALPSEYGSHQAAASRRRFIKGVVQREGVVAALLDIGQLLEAIRLP